MKKTNNGAWAIVAIVMVGGGPDAGAPSDPLDSSEPNMQTLSAVEASYRHTCVLLPTGNVECYGENAYGQAEDYHGGDATAIATSYGTTCALRTDANATCWGDLSDDYEHGGARAIAAGDSHACVLLFNNTVDCWGHNGDGQAEDYLFPDAVGIAAGSGYSCALLGAGNVDCWGLSGAAVDYGPLVPSYRGPAVAVDAAAATCILLVTGEIGCWGVSSYLQEPLRVVDWIFDGRWNGLRDPAVALDVDVSRVCALLKSGDVVCWGYNPTAYNGLWSGLSLGPNVSWRVWREDDLWPSDTSEFRGRAVDVAAGEDHTCVLLVWGSVHCWSSQGGSNGNRWLSDDPETSPTRDYAVGPAVSVDAGHEHTCAVLSNGNVHCWGANDAGQSFDQTERYTAVAANGKNTCALTSQYNINCWGDTFADYLFVSFYEWDSSDGTGSRYAWYEGYEPARAISTSGSGGSFCAIIVGVYCWSLYGGERNGYPVDPLDDETLGHVVSLSAVETRACVLIASGNVDCWSFWGESRATEYGTSSSNYLGPATGVATGYAFTCVLVQGSVHCWGSPGANPTEGYGVGDPNFQGPATAISSGGDHTCALIANGNVECWGANEYGEAEDYSGGDAITVDAGPDHTCAVLSSGNVKCWGQNNVGQAEDYIGAPGLVN